MKRTGRILAALGVLMVIFGLGACVKDSGENNQPTANHTTKAAHSPTTTDPGSTATATDSTEDLADDAGGENAANHDRYCLAVDTFYDVTLNAVKKVDMTSVDSITQYINDIRSSAEKASASAPDDATANLWHEYATSVSLDNLPTPDVEFGTKVSESATRYCPSYDFKHLAN